MTEYTLDEINELTNLCYVLDVYDDVNHPELYNIIKDAINNKYPDFDKDPEGVFDACYEQFYEKLKAYLVQRWPNCDIDGINFFYEYPDLSKSYTNKEICDTFNSYSDIEQIIQETNTSGQKFYLTKKTYGKIGNVMDVNTIDSMIGYGLYDYIYENAETNEYLVLFDDDILILFDRKQDFAFSY